MPTLLSFLRRLSHLGWLLFTLTIALGDRAPNFILIFIDDQGYQDLGCYGSPNIQTPNLDRMAAEGLRFTDFYSLAPVCSASRAALMTGCYPLRVGITGVLFPRHRVGLNPAETTMAEVLKGEGYATACVGKWHLGHHPEFLPTNHGFDRYYGIPYSNDMDGVQGKNRNLDRAWGENDVTPWNVPLMRNEVIVERPAQQATITRRYTEEAIRFIEEHAEAPFFLYLPHTMPHIPLFVSEAFYQEDPQKAYASTIAEIDWSVGQILKTVKRLGLDEDTLVVYTSDNGPWLGMKHHGGSALPLRDGKFSTYEGGMRVPCLARWPGKIAPGQVTGEVAATFDLLPTFAHYAGATLSTDQVIDGNNIAGLLEGREESPHEAFFYYRGNRLEAVRRGPWKLNRKGQRRRNQSVNSSLHHLLNDIGETSNLIVNHPGIAQELEELAQSFDASLKANRRPVGNLDNL